MNSPKTLHNSLLWLRLQFIGFTFGTFGHLASQIGPNYCGLLGTLVCMILICIATTRNQELLHQQLLSCQRICSVLITSPLLHIVLQLQFGQL